VPAIRTTSLRKVYPAPQTKRRRDSSALREGTRPSAWAPSTDGAAREIVALEGLDLEVADGEFFGLLGPNGAGKTTTIGILTTRIRPTGGTATVAGADVARESAVVRRRIGVVPQRPNPDRSLNVLDNLVFHAAYFGIPRSVATPRAEALLLQMDLADRAASMIEHLSGGQQQRLMIARALIHEPQVIFLDEPTVGLDPQARHDLWDILLQLQMTGRTIVMTTHYMEEADHLCDRVAIVHRGRLLAIDTPAALKARAPGGTLIELELDGDASPAAEDAATCDGVARAEAEGHTLRVFTERGGEMIPTAIRIAEQRGRSVRDIHLSPPSLETLFISLTGRKLD